MRTSAISAAIFALTILPLTLHAEDDFSALLADLSFGDAPSLEETASNRSLSLAEDKVVADLKPVPTGLTMPETTETTQPVDASEAAQIALQDPIPAKAPKASRQIDLEAAFALTDPPPPAATEIAIAAQPVGHVHHGCVSNECVSNCGDSEVICTPHDKVHLPSSSLLQYFRSNACNTHVWDGYQQKCPCHNKHVTGQCDCFKGHGKAGCAAGVSCAGGCDR